MKNNVINVIKRDGTSVMFNVNKIKQAVMSANKSVKDERKHITEEEADRIVKGVNNFIRDGIHVEEIQDIVEELLMSSRRPEVAKAYILYRHKRGLCREANTTDYNIISLVRNRNRDVMDENSNKNAIVASTQRDLIAGIVSRDISERLLLPPHIVRAHKEGVLHFHDSDYFIQPTFNCCLVNIKDMLDNGTVLNGKLIESPKTFQVACTVMTQIIASVASNQYGGQSVDVAHLGKYLHRSIEKYKAYYNENFPELDEKTKNKMIEDRVKEELKAGVQTIQYQINTLMTTNGQSPFVTLFLYVRDEDEYADETALIIAEILRQRYEGIKNEKGVYITPAFPKLVYVLDENNCLKGGKWDSLTHLSALCSSKRMYPDYISAKKMRENYNGNVFSPMGCRSFLSPWKNEKGEYQFEGRFNQGVVSLNLPQIGLVAKKLDDGKSFWKLLDERLELCYEALMCRHVSLLGTKSDTSPIHWQHGAIARLKKGEKIDKLLKGGYSTLSLGYIGLYELTKIMIDKPHTSKEGREFAYRVMLVLKNACAKWKEYTGLGFALYGTPAESLCYRFARIDKEQFGSIKDITDKGYYTNSYHVDVREHIDAFSKLDFESDFQGLSTGGAISYIEVPNMAHNVEAIETILKHIYENIQYAELNFKSDYCHICGFDGEIIINDEDEWECPNCHNKDHTKMNVTRRTCGYLGENFWNVGKTKEIKARVLHL